MPIFWEGELVAWSGIAMHDEDVGSPVPGSFVAGAADRFGEAPLFPGIKMVTGFAPRRDVLRAYLRNSRTSELNALNMRARVAALRTTYQRIQELIGRVRRWTPSSPRRRGSSSTSSASCARACARSPTAAGSARSTTTTTAPTTRSTGCAAG